MKFNIKGIFFFLFICISCLEEEELEIDVRDYSILQTVPASQVDSSGVTLNGRITLKGKEPIQDYGFIYKSTGSRAIEKIESLGENCICDTFSYRIKFDLEKNTEYEFKAYIKTENYEIYGDDLYFSSLGVSPPKIHKLSKESAFLDDTLVIYGNHFSAIKEKIKVSFGSLEANIISNSVDSIKVLVPRYETADFVDLIVQVRNHQIIYPNKFELMGPEIYEISPKSGYREETIFTVSGKNFTKFSTNTYIKIGNRRIWPLEVTDDEIKFKMADYFDLGNYSFSVYTGSLNTEVFSESFEIKSRWKELTPFPGIPRKLSSCFQVEDKFYVFLGHTRENEFLNEVWVYEIKNDHWKQLGNFLGEERVNQVGFLLDDFIYLGFGENDEMGSLRDFWKYSIANDSWEEINEGGNILYNGELGFGINGKGYFIEKDFDIEVYDIGTSDWDLYYGPSSSYHLNNYPVFLNGENLVYFNFFNSYRGFAEFNTNTNQFSELNDLPPSISFGSRVQGTLLEENVFYFYGKRNFKKFDLIQNTWETKEYAKEVEIANPNMFSYEGKVYLTLGYEGYYPSNKIWVYDTSLE